MTLPLAKTPLAIHIVERDRISRGRPTWGLDEALASVPGVYAANRYNFSQEQRISIRGFGSRSAFAVRGIKVLLDGIPQTLPDGQGQLTNLELGEADRIEVLRGSASSLFGNASGGVISIWTDPRLPEHVTEDARVVVGRFDGRSDRTWSKWQSTTVARLGSGLAQLTVSRLDYEGERDHSAADLRSFNARVRFPVGSAWSVAALLDVGDAPRADNPGSLTGAELAANPDSAPALNLNRHAGKDDSGDRLMRSLSGSLGVALSLSDAFTVYGNIGSSFETPTTTELANRPDTTGGFNSGLRPAWNYEVGARGEWGERATYSLAVFQADVRGELIPYEIAAPRFFYRNAGSSRHRGVELGADLTPLPGLSLNASWTYSDYRFRRYSFSTAGQTFTLDGHELPGVPKHWLHLTLRAHPSLARGAWAEVEQTYSSGYLVSDTVGTSAANARTSPWWATTLRLGWEGEVGSMRVAPFLGVNNLFNHRYVGSVVINAARGRYFEPAPGRNLYLGLSLGAGR